MVTSTAKRPDLRASGASARHAGQPDADPAPLLTPAVFHILLALADGESHGYGIMQDVERFTNGDTRLGPGTLYRSIQRMLVDGLIEELAISLHDEADEDRRRYYRLTAKGLEAARREARRLADLVDAARHRNLFSTRRPTLDDERRRPPRGQLG